MGAEYGIRTTRRTDIKRKEHLADDGVLQLRRFPLTVFGRKEILLTSALFCIAGGRSSGERRCLARLVVSVVRTLPRSSYVFSPSDIDLSTFSHPTSFREKGERLGSASAGSV